MGHEPSADFRRLQLFNEGRIDGVRTGRLGALILAAPLGPGRRGSSLAAWLLMANTIDQQQFWRGYMPVLLLTHYIKYGLVEANYFLTGPTIVDASNVEQVAALVEQGYR